MSRALTLEGISADGNAARYLDLMKKCLTNTAYEGEELVAVRPQGRIKARIARALEAAGFTLARRSSTAVGMRAKGLDRNPRADTMIGLARLANIQQCVESALADAIPGDLIEAGVWRGGAAAFMRAILKAHGARYRTVWVADSFEGLPPPDEARYPQDRGDEHHLRGWLAVSMEEVKETFRKY